MAKDTDNFDEYQEEQNTGLWRKIKLGFSKNVNIVRNRRLTRDIDGKHIGASITPMHKDNIKKLKNAYRHPFQKIPAEYFEIR